MSDPFNDTALDAGAGTSPRRHSHPQGRARDDNTSAQTRSPSHIHLPSDRTLDGGALAEHCPTCSLRTPPGPSPREPTASLSKGSEKEWGGHAGARGSPRSSLDEEEKEREADAGDGMDTLDSTELAARGGSVCAATEEGNRPFEKPYFYDCGMPQWLTVCEAAHDADTAAAADGPRASAGARKRRVSHRCGRVAHAGETVVGHEDEADAAAADTAPAGTGAGPAVILERLPHADSAGVSDAGGPSGASPLRDGSESRYSVWWSEGAAALLTGRYYSDDFFPGGTWEEREARAYGWELVLSMLPTALAAAVSWPVTQRLWRGVQFWLRPLAPRIHRFAAPLAPHEAETKARVWAARRETFLTHEDGACASGDDADGARLAHSLGGEMAAAFASFM